MTFICENVEVIGRCPRPKRTAIRIIEYYIITEFGAFLLDILVIIKISKDIKKISSRPLHQLLHKY